MSSYVPCGRYLRVHPAVPLLGVFLLIFMIFALPSVGFSAVAAETIIINPINLTCTLLPTQIIVVNNNGTGSESLGLFESSSNGVAGILRVSGSD